jgi:serine/threonine protein kinase
MSPAIDRVFRNNERVRISWQGGHASTLPPPADEPKPRIGDVLDNRYRITGILGSGGMGCVYLAEHISIRRPLALKLLHPEVEGIDEINQRFEREAFAIGRMNHPNCVNVSDFGKLDDGTLYMVLELLDGVMLSDLLERERRVHWRRVLHIGRHVLSALECAHNAGIIHRDIKPENVILVDQDGDRDFAKILDFGIAKIRDDAQPEENTGILANDAKLTQHGVTIGTPTYIAPEQAYGQPIDGRADLYAFSVMMYEMITGDPPFDADEVGALLRMHVSHPVPPFAELAPNIEVPEEVEALIMHGLAKQPNDRVPSAKAYIKRIDTILEQAVEESGSGLREIPAIVGRGLRQTVTPAVLRAASRGRSKKAIMAAAVAFAIGLGALLLGIGTDEPEYLPQNRLAPLIPDSHGPEAKEAAAILAKGRPREAVAFLMEHHKEVRDEPYAQMVLGHAQASAQRNILALAAYEKAVKLEPKLAKDKVMRTNVELMLSKKAPGVVDAALELLGTLYEAGDWAAADQLVDLASSSKAPRRRHTALEVADKVGLGHRVDRVSSYALDLDQGETCEIRRDAVGKLRALGDKKAIPHLKNARKRMRTQGAFVKRRVNTNACLTTAANEAIRYLQSL